jgi:hypothetical protein
LAKGTDSGDISSGQLFFKLNAAGFVDTTRSANQELRIRFVCSLLLALLIAVTAYCVIITELPQPLFPIWVEDGPT